MAIVYTDKPLPERHPFDYYRTPPEFARLGLQFLWDTAAHFDYYRERPNLLWAPKVLDPGAGCGVWGAALKEDYPNAVVHGVELREVVRPAAYDSWAVGDFRSGIATLGNLWDLVVGNPPYADAEVFIRRSLEAVREGGCVLFLLKLSFLQSKGRAEGLFSEHPPCRVAVCKTRPRFTGPGNPDSFAFYLWRKGWTGETTLTWV